MVQLTVYDSAEGNRVLRVLGCAGVLSKVQLSRESGSGALQLDGREVPYTTAVKATVLVTSPQLARDQDFAAVEV
jgi:hypothetical protein